MPKNKLKFNKKFNTRNPLMMMGPILTRRCWMHTLPEMLGVIQIKPLLRRLYSKTKGRQLRLKKMLLAIRWPHLRIKSPMKRFKLKLHQFKKLLLLPPLLLLQSSMLHQLNQLHNNKQLQLLLKDLFQQVLLSKKLPQLLQNLKPLKQNYKLLLQKAKLLNHPKIPTQLLIKL